jgi:hypothetical protein
MQAGIMDSDFTEAVETGNRRMVRIKLGNIITIDPTLKSFREMLKYAEKYMPDLWDIHHGELCLNGNEWTKDYYTEQQSELCFNFSHERIELLCEMAKKLYAERINTINTERSMDGSNENQTVKDILADFIKFIGDGLEYAGRKLKSVSDDIHGYR